MYVLEYIKKNSNNNVPAVSGPPEQASPPGFVFQFFLLYYLFKEAEMDKRKYVYWKDEDFWIGYLEEFPDYHSQGETLEELKENLRDIYSELTSGTIPNVRRVDELEVA